MATFQYFAYGSNMLTERLRARCASAKVIAVAVVSRYTLEFSKPGRDGPGKATIVRSNNSDQTVLGLVFDIAISQRPALEKGRRCRRWLRED
jgi:gamma-glutamylcyclotransferase